MENSFIFVTVLWVSACGGAYYHDHVTQPDATPDAQSDACSVWFDPAGGECTDTCSGQLVACPDAGSSRDAAPETQSPGECLAPPRSDVMPVACDSPGVDCSTCDAGSCTVGDASGTCLP